MHLKRFVYRCLLLLLVLSPHCMLGMQTNAIFNVKLKVKLRVMFRLHHVGRLYAVMKHVICTATFISQTGRNRQLTRSEKFHNLFIPLAYSLTHYE